MKGKSKDDSERLIEPESTCLQNLILIQLLGPFSTSNLPFLAATGQSLGVAEYG